MRYTVNEIKDRAVTVAKKYNIKEMYLFGSYARNEAKENSDIDLAVDTESIHGLLQLNSLRFEMQDAFTVPVDVLTLRSIDSEKNNPIKREFFDNFVRERVCLLNEKR